MFKSQTKEHSKIIVFNRSSGLFLQINEDLIQGNTNIPVHG